LTSSRKSEPIAYLLRHGDTLLSDKGIIISRTDVEPNKEGRKQSKKALAFLEDKGIEDIYSSPLKRCFDIASEFAGTKQVIQHRSLLPWDRGILTGVLSDEAEDLIKLLLVNPTVKIPHGESRIDAEDRISELFSWALEKAEKRKAVFFTHHTVIDFLNCLLTGERLDDPPNVVEVGGVAAIYVDGDGYAMEPVLNPAENTVAVS
jgi:broad specificity phosphatase PhoE